MLQLFIRIVKRIVKIVVGDSDLPLKLNVYIWFLHLVNNCGIIVCNASDICLMLFYFNVMRSKFVGLFSVSE